MRGLPKYHHSYHTFLFLFIFLILYRLVSSININTLSSTDFLTLSSNQTIVSPGYVFELGFFRTTSNSWDDDRWYLGIWYKTIPERTYVWVANRDKPLFNSTGTLKISNNNLYLLNQADIPIWSTNLTERDVRYPMVAELLDNGNFVLRVSETSDPYDILWQSFDFPTDTLLPDMEIGWDLKTGRNKFLRSWKNQYEPSSGDFSYRLEPGIFPEFFLWKLDLQVFRSGPWDGIQFSGIPEMQRWNNVNIVYNFTENREKVAYTFRVNDHNSYWRMIMGTAGLLQLSTWDRTIRGWEVFWFSSMELCDMYLRCGPYSYCDMNTIPLCNCIKGFVPTNSEEWALNDGSSGCMRSTPLSCNGDEFFWLKRVKLPETTAVTILERKTGLKECEERCLKDCNCTAFANEDLRNGGSGCAIWTGELLDIRNFANSGQDLYVRLAAIALGEERKGKIQKIVILIVVVSFILLLGLIMFCIWKRKHKRARTSAAVPIEINQDVFVNGMVVSSRRHLVGEDITEDLELPVMELEAVVMATQNFSDCNKLGEGGYGIVYKGRLCDGQEIAVKRLSEMSHQGTNEFKNEVKLISRLQHINLVRLLGCCIEGGEKMLIYEYLENLSLDSHIFDKSRSCNLNWQMRFSIINGIARGLLYLHQDSRFRIIHRDLKASNVLLDKDMTPKISDFGMARIFGRDETEANTRKVVGTYGYMSPEYAMYGRFSLKSDVFSFGVMLLEIISGKRNTGYYNSNHDLDLLSCVWRNWKDEKGLEIVDPIIIGTSSSSTTFQPQEILRRIQIGLLCVQERAEDRPMMSSVVLMLGSETVEMPQPNPPGYCISRSSLETDSSSSQQHDDSWTMNQITISVIDAR